MLTEVKEVFIEEQTYAGSAFGVTAEGDGVFFNSRIVEAVKGGMSLKEARKKSGYHTLQTSTR